jgi:hypothetical protein
MSEATSIKVAPHLGLLLARLSSLVGEIVGSWSFGFSYKLKNPPFFLSRFPTKIQEIYKDSVKYLRDTLAYNLFLIFKFFKNLKHSPRYRSERRVFKINTMKRTINSSRTITEITVMNQFRLYNGELLFFSPRINIKLI